MNIEYLILQNIINDEKFLRKVMPFIKSDYFDQKYGQITYTIFTELTRYVRRYDKIPSIEEFEIDLADNSNITNIELKAEVMDSLHLVFNKNEDVNEEWLLDKTEKWCQERAVINAVLEVFDIVKSNSENRPIGTIVPIMQDAVNIAFDNSIGHNYFEDVDERFDFYHNKSKRLPFDIELLNRITGGGLPNKSLTVAMARPGGGKSLFMCHSASAHLAQGHNVLYLTMEMSEEKIAERIDANLLDIPINRIRDLSRDDFTDKVTGLKKKTAGTLIVKEYSGGYPHAGHFRALINDLKIKKKFVPRVIYVDYLNICSAVRIKMGTANTYTYMKEVAQDIRGLAQEFDVPIVTATQSNREGATSNDPELENASESYGIPATCDVMFSIISYTEPDRENVITIKQLKNRYNDLNSFNRFDIGVDRSKMKLFDIDNGYSELESGAEAYKAIAKPKVAGKGVKNIDSTGIKFTDF